MLVSFDKSFAVVARMKKLLNATQIFQIETTLKAYRQNKLEMGFDDIAKSMGVLTDEDIKRIRRTQQRHARRCSKCQKLTYLLPRQRSATTPCEHCGAALIAGPVDDDTAFKTQNTRARAAGRDTTRRYLKEQNLDAGLPESLHDSVVVVVNQRRDETARKKRSSEFLVFEEQAEEQDPAPTKYNELPNYSLHERLGQGSMYSVYRGRHKVLDEDFAVKFLRSDKLTEKRIKRFIQEAKICLRLSHKNLVRFFELGQLDDCYYMITEYVDGPSLRDKMTEVGPMHWQYASRLLQQIVDGAAAIHEAGVVHRDLKPENILLTKDDEVKILDFGFAKDLLHGESLTDPFRFVGTPLYITPELGVVEDQDQRADIYCLGLIYYQLITGSHPFQNNSMRELLKKLAHQNVTDPRNLVADCPDSVLRVLGKMLAFDRDYRYLTVESLKEDLRRVVFGLEVEAEAPRLWAAKRAIEEAPESEVKTFNSLKNLWDYVLKKDQKSQGDGASD